MKTTFAKWWKSKWTRITLIFVSAFLLFYLGFINHVEPSEIGLVRDELSGETWRQSPGWHLTPFWVRVSNVDTRPIRVTVSSGGKGISAKLVRFDPDHYQEFLATEGFRYYWWSNRLSFNWSHDEEYRGFRDIMRGYAYGSKRYPFIVFLDGYEQR